MTTVYKYQNVRLSRIDIDDATFLISTSSDLEALLNSIRQFGLLNPPLLIPAGDKLVIVSGFQRIRACKMLGLDTITARMLDNDVERLKCIQWAIIDNTAQRQLNVVEQARALWLLATTITDRSALIAMANALFFMLPGTNSQRHARRMIRQGE